LDSQFQQTMQVGVGPQHREIGFPISTDNASWGGAPTQRNWIPNFNRQCNICMTNQHNNFSFTSLNQ
ncbi:hypothetical protein, partial [Staphylococcus aureus]|uniref:hypothetical protein n=1 Tax=Staphylococcus aureus TaxID=1280 RepID=UPI0032E3A014